MEKYKINDSDMNKNFFHFTAKKNLDSIDKNGLVPYVGAHAKYIEKNKKVFFVEGLDNLLVLFDCWINVYYYMPKIPMIYTLGSHFLRQKWFPQMIADGYFKILKVSKLHRKRAFKVFNKLLDSSILLKLDLEENIDFKYDDKDEIKLWGYQERHLKIMGYKDEYSNLNTLIMDRWNMHTLANRGVESKKIKLCVIENEEYRLREIFNYCLKNTKLDIENKCPVLYDYLCYQNKKEI